VPPPPSRPPNPRALRAAVAAGTALAGRYRLTEPLPANPDDPDEAQRWLAVDDVLARPVEVLLLLAHGKRAPWGRALLQAAADAGTVSSPVLTSVYDAALEEVPGERFGRPAGGVDVAYVVAEHVRGGVPLAETLLEDGPLEPASALRLALEGAEGLRAAHASGVVHGRVSPATVLLTAEGLRLRDTAVAAALSERLEDTPPPAASEADDVRDLTACLYAMLTARWPGRGTTSPSAGLPPAPLHGGREGRLCSPRQVRAGVPRHLDETVVRVLDPDHRPSGASSPAPVTTADGLLRALQAAMDADAPGRSTVPRTPRRLPRPAAVLLRASPLVLVLALLVGVGVVGFLRGVELGTVQTDGSELEALVDSTPSPVPGDDGGGQRLDLAAPGTSVTAFDPAPGDGSENNAAVANVVDGDPGTAWETERYESERFGGLKEGVGLLVDLGDLVTVEQVEIGLAPGTDVELRIADEPFPTAGEYSVVASVGGSEAIERLVPEEPVTARYFLVWLTALPPDEEGGFRGAVRELFFVQP
jgi:hypothetical protein